MKKQYYCPVDPAVKRANHQAAAKKRWILLHERRAGRVRRMRLISESAKALRGLRKAVVRQEFILRNRARSLHAYHQKAVRVNILRRIRPLDYYLQQALKRRSVDLTKRQKALEHSARRMLISKVEQRLRKTLRRRFEKAMKSYVSSSVVLKMTGLPLFDLRAHLERQFKPGMSWFNYGFRGWHIDHIKPLAAFAPGDAAAFHYTNLQPLWMAENLKKGAS
jgi:hypothetical protein